MELGSRGFALAGFSARAGERAYALAVSIGARCVALPRRGDIAASTDTGFSAIIVAAPVDRAILIEARRRFPDVPLVACGRDPSQQAALSAIRAGADDFICTRGDDSALLARLRHYASCPPEAAGPLAGGDTFVGPSKAVAHIKSLVGKLGRSSSTILIRGETGTGKEVVALMLHRNSPRAAGPLVPINCAAIPETLIEGELFGYEKGSFSSASRAYPGKFRLADGGTLFLDEVGELSLAAQSKLLRAIESGEIFPLGSLRAHHADVRIVAATNRDLHAEIARGNFRADLFYRLAVIQVAIPPLRDRREDIVPIARFLLANICEDLHVPAPALAGDFVDRLVRHDWPGNVREMRNALEHALVVAERPDRLAGGDLPATVAGRVRPEQGGDADERGILLRALALADGKKAGAARALNCSRMTLYRRLERAGVDSRTIAQLS
jgi:DNA-binding NtrC family response regulator